VCDDRRLTRSSHRDGDGSAGATTTGAGELTVGVGSTVAQLLPSGKPNLRFARGGVIRITKPAQVSINAVVRFGSGRVVLAGFGGDAVYVARYLLATCRRR
jgi:hypothetical protein